MSPILPREFYAQPAPVVARGLLGARLVRRIDGQRVGGVIVETEAYTGLDDLASHGRVKPTPRNRPMWGTPGHAYVYLIYGLYWLFNVVCEPEGCPAAVLIRALEPRENLSERTDGPGRLARALQIGVEHNTADLTTPAAGLWIEAGEPVPDERVRTGPRIGLGRRVTEPWRSMPWRWWVDGSPHVSQ